MERGIVRIHRPQSDLARMLLGGLDRVLPDGTRIDFRVLGPTADDPAGMLGAAADDPAGVLGAAADDPAGMLGAAADDPAGMLGAAADLAADLSQLAADLGRRDVDGRGTEAEAAPLRGRAGGQCREEDENDHADGPS